jgi:DNA repair protein RadA/Sms
VVACGYADGYPRHAPTGTPILVGGRRTRTLGRVSMDMLACDLSHLPEAGVGTPVTLWGDGLAADEVAAAAGTISYELFCALAPRVPVSVRGAAPDGQGQDRARLLRMRRQVAPLAGPVPPLQGLEHPGRIGGRARGAGGQALAALAGDSGRLQTLADIRPRESSRVPTGIDEFDRVLGGGLVPGGVVLIGGDPASASQPCCCRRWRCSPAPQGAVRERRGIRRAGGAAASRLQLDAHGLQLLPEINLERILGTLRDVKPDVAVVDSIQTVYSETLGSAPGSVAQVRECAAQLTRFAKQGGTTLIMVGHVTKDGALAGPRVLEHIVDTVLYFEGDTHSSFRLVRAFKNRFGAVNELGVFAMTEKG